MIAVVIKIISRILWLRLVKPKYLDSFIIIVLACFLPEISSCSRIRRIVVNSIAHEVHDDPEATVSADQKTLLKHLFIVLRSWVNGWPDRNHELNVEGFELFDHCVGVWPVVCIKPPVALFGPMEEVDNNEVNWQRASFVLACDREEFFLCLVSELALPEAEAVFGHHGNYLKLAFYLSWSREF